MEDLLVELLKVLIYSQVNLLRVEFFTKVVRLELITAIFKKVLHHRGFSTCIGKFSVRYFCKTFSNEVAGLQGSDFIENNVFDRNI